MGPDDSQAQALFTVENCILDEDCALWSLSETTSALTPLASDRGVDLVIQTHPNDYIALARFDSDTRTGTITLPVKGMVGDLMVTTEGRYASWVPLHELAHIFTASMIPEHETPAHPSHGPDFVATYLSLLEDHGFNCRRVRAALRHLGVDWSCRVA